MSNMTANRQQALNAAIDRDCPICHCEMVLPTAVPACQHKFCFMCLKGVNMNHLGGCPICRGPIDDNIFRRPTQQLDIKMPVPDSPTPSTSSSTDREVKQEVDEDVKPDVDALNASMNNPPPILMYWLYHGRRQGWWRFDPRIEKDIEEAYIARMPVTEVVICGQPYVIDFSNMTQYPKNNRTHSRDVKRVDAHEFDASNVKGLAGVFKLTR
uniref:E3 ubiquitin-protein ligase n=1 Tax=Caenorhabditis tropicalis TaxID=1561998 RepID=A0A1I7UT03_9PELO